MACAHFGFLGGAHTHHANDEQTAIVESFRYATYQSIEIWNFLNAEQRLLRISSFHWPYIQRVKRYSFQKETLICSIGFCNPTEIHSNYMDFPFNRPIANLHVNNMKNSTVEVFPIKKQSSSSFADKL